MNSKLVWLTLALAVSCALATKTTYEGYKLLDIFPETQEQFELISELEHNPDFDLWSRHKIDGSKVALSPSALHKYLAIFKMFKIRYQIVHENLQEIFDEEDRRLRKRELSKADFFGDYSTYSDITNWIAEKVEKNKDFVSSYVAGQTEEKRDMTVIVIGSKTATRKIWIDCGIHAREWVSPYTCTWIADKLIEGVNKNDQSVLDTLAYHEFHILPVMNPDGYDFTRQTRMWRKNRRVNSGSTCLGVDLNRNFGYQWGTGGSSALPCSDTYKGPTADSELETKAVQSAINAHLGKWDSFLTIHSYGKWLFTPYGYSDKVLPLDMDVLNSTANASINALAAVYNEDGWTCGSSSQILYIASGGSEDWAYETAGIKYSYCFELRPGQTGTDSQYGFTLPPEKAPLAGQETFVGIMKLVSLIPKI